MKELQDDIRKRLTQRSHARWKKITLSVR